MSPQKLRHQTLCLLNRRGTEEMPLARPNMRITIELPLAAWSAGILLAESRTRAR